MDPRIGSPPGPDAPWPEGLPVALRPAREPDFRQDRARRSYLALIVSVGTFYRYFTDKHEIYLEIARRTMVAAYRKTIADLGPERFVGRARRETISETIAILFDHVLSQPELTRSLREMSLRDPQVAELARAFEQVSVARIATLMTSLVPRDIIPDPEATAWVLHAAVVEAANSLAGHRGAPLISAERARRALTDFIERAVFPRT
jgi:AcrR family transcriptional regulator